MKRLGYTNTENVIVECTPKEFKMLTVLSEVASGKTLWATDNTPQGWHNGELVDLEPVFKAVADWVSVKSRANELRQLASMIDDSLENLTNEVKE